MKKLSAIRFLAMIIIALTALSANLSAKDNTTENMSEAKFKTSAYSFMCKNQIENELSGHEGISEAYLDLETKVVTVKYDASKVKTDQICKGIESLGYEAKQVDKDCTKKDHKCCDKKKSS
jgi:copper chaperone CopZ